MEIHRDASPVLLRHFHIWSVHSLWVNDHFIHDVDEKNYKLTLSQAAKRAFGYLTCYLTFGIFFIFNFASEDKRGLADYISSSRTVSDRWLKEMIEYKLHQREQLSIEISSLSVSA